LYEGSFSMYFKHVPNIVKPLAKDLIFDLPNEDQNLFLTFDDGPHPEITPWVMDELDRFDAKATFFLIGKNVVEYPELLEELLERGHAIGNHSHSHKSGWKTANTDYFSDVEACANHVQSTLFRPPYGEISRSQSVHLKKEYKIILWSDLSADFDAAYTADDCVRFATSKVKSGSIVVFHDSEKAWPRLEAALPRCLEYYSSKRLKMAPIHLY